MTAQDRPTTRKASYVLALMLTLLPTGTSLGVMMAGETDWVAVVAGSAVGVVVGTAWVLYARRFYLSAFVFVLGIYAPGCAGEMGPDVRVVLDGIPKHTVAEAAEGERETIEITDGVARLDHLGISSEELKQKRPGITHHTYFFAPVGPAEGHLPKPASVWLACFASMSVDDTRDECTKKLKATPTFGRFKPQWAPDLRPVATKQAIDTGPSPRVYEVLESPVNEAWSNLSVLLAILVVGGGFAMYMVQSARRTPARR